MATREEMNHVFSLIEKERAGAPCDQCGGKRRTLDDPISDDAVVCFDPWAQEVHGEYRLVYICGACYRESLMDI